MIFFTVRKLVLISFVVGITTTSAYAGLFATLGPKYQVSSFTPKEGTKSINHYGIGLDLNLGFSIAQIFDTAIFAAYTPSSLEKPKAATGEVNVYNYGGTFGLRISDSLYFGVRGGKYHYVMKNKTLEDEVDGDWSGTGGGVLLGAFFPAAKKNHYFQLNLHFDRAKMTRNDSVDDESLQEDDKLLDVFGVSFIYVFNAKGSTVGGSILGNFLDSLIF